MSAVRISFVEFASAANVVTDKSVEHVIAIDAKIFMTLNVLFIVLHFLNIASG